LSFIVIPSPVGGPVKIGEQPNHWAAPAGIACFDLVMPGDIYPCGWILIDSWLIHYGANVTARLCFDTGNGFSDALSITVLVTRKGRIHELIQFPPKVIGLRWQVMNVQGEFA